MRAPPVGGAVTDPFERQTFHRGPAGDRLRPVPDAVHPAVVARLRELSAALCHPRAASDTSVQTMALAMAIEGGIGRATVRGPEAAASATRPVASADVDALVVQLYTDEATS